MTFKVSTRIENATCEMTIVQLNATSVLLRISGNDIGEFMDVPMRCIDALLSPNVPANLFVDTRETQGVTMTASGAWAAWLEKRRNSFESIHFLASGRYVTVSAQFVRRFSGLEDTMHIYEDPAIFDAQMLGVAASG